MIKTKENGITLIALIITIIVMLILVGVTVSVALNGGLFKTAKDAATGTQVEADRETLQAGVVGALNEALEIPNAITLQNNLPNGWIVEGEGPYIATSPNENSFKVEQDGTIKVVKNLTPLERYIFGEEGIGRDVFEILEFSTGHPSEFKDDYLGLEILGDCFGAYNDYIGYSDVYSYIDCYMKYEGKTYKFRMSPDYENGTLTTNPDEGVKLVYEPIEETKVGKYVQYDEKDWVVLYDDNINGLQMISLNVLERNNVYLGYDDPTVVESEVEDIDGDGKKSDQEKAIYSYNHAIETLNKKCESLVTAKEGIVQSVRSVGSNPTNPDSENKTPFYSKELAEKANGLGNNIGFSADNNYLSDAERIIALGLSSSNNNYWLASRLIYWNGDNLCFTMRLMRDDRISAQDYLWQVYNFSRLDCYDNRTTFRHGVRPVITLEPGALDGLTGEGTAENPWILQ